MKLAIYTSCMICIICGCTNCLFQSNLNSWLSLKDVEIMNSQTFDQFGGFGEGATLVIYTLASENIIAFQNKKCPKLPKKEKFYSVGWQKGNVLKKDSIINKTVNSILNISGYGNIENYLIHIQSLIQDENNYIAFYYNRNYIENANSFLLLVLVPSEKNLYIYELIS